MMELTGENGDWREIVHERLRNVDQRRQHLLTARGGEMISIQDRSLLVELPPERSVLSTSWLNGGYRENLECVLNHEAYEGLHGLMGQKDMPEYLTMVARSLGLQPNKVTGLATAASMRNAAIVRQEHSGIEVVAVVTAGVETNGGRAGDPASYHSEIDKTQYCAGTINTILIIGAFLPPNVMARASMTATEAKTCALQQLMAPSRYSCGLATGSGTDMIAVISDMSSERVLLDAGKHNKLGEMIGRTVIEATTSALQMQNGLTSSSQMDALVRLGRYNVTKEDVWSVAETMSYTGGREEFMGALHRISKRPEVVAEVAALLHIQDEMAWGLLPERIGMESARRNLDAFLSDGLFKIGGASPNLSASEGVLTNLVRFMAALAMCDAGGQRMRIDEAPTIGNVVLYPEQLRPGPSPMTEVPPSGNARTSDEIEAMRRVAKK